MCDSRRLHVENRLLIFYFDSVHAATDDQFVQLSMRQAFIVPYDAPLDTDCDLVSI